MQQGEPPFSEQEQLDINTLKQCIDNVVKLVGTLTEAMLSIGIGRHDAGVLYERYIQAMQTFPQFSAQASAIYAQIEADIHDASAISTLMGALTTYEDVILSLSKDCAMYIARHKVADTTNLH